MEATKAWQAVVGQLQMEMPKATFDTWVKGADFVAYEDGAFIVGSENAFTRDWLDSRLSSTISRLLSGMMGRTVEVTFTVWQKQNSREEVVAKSADLVEDEIEKITSPNITLNPQYSFDNFVVGSNTRLAHAASMAVAEKPAQAYNPLFLYGGVGLGKTHLLNAIGWENHRNNLNVLYVSSEEFTNDLINAIRANKTQAFRDRYRHCDVLLIDDIQFIAGKESTQEEFFHTFNTLHGQNKQIVITSDRSPKAMITLEERLRSRFEWGLTADIQTPDIETRLAILRFKADRMGKQVPDEVLEIIAKKMQTNIRELEGALNRIVAYADLRGMELSPALVDMALVDLIPQRREMDVDKIIEVVAESFGIPVERLLSRERTKKIALPRQIAMFLLRDEAHMSLPQIGESLGGRDHTTVMYGCDKIAKLLEQDDRMRRQVVEIRDALYGQSHLSR